MSDTAQLSLWATGPLARKTDPETSFAAPPSPKVLSELQSLVLNEFVQLDYSNDRSGLTDDELCSLIPNRCVGSVKKRRTELVRSGALVDSGRRRPTVTGRDAIVWVLVGHA